MLSRLYRRARRLASPVHPRRLLFYAHHGANLIGLLPACRRLGRFLFGVARACWPRRLAATGRWGWTIAAAIRRRRRERRLTVAVDVTAFREPRTGIGWYLYRLLEQLAARRDVRLRLYGPHLVATPELPPPIVEPPAGEAIEVVRYPVPAGLSVGPMRLARWLRRCAPRLIAADRNELLFAPNYFLPSCFDRCRGRLVVTVHDLSFLRVPETMREKTRRDLATHLRRSMERAVRVLTDSETVRGELRSSGLADGTRVDAVLLGPGPVADVGAETPRPASVPARYVLHVGTVEPRKNLPTLFAAWRRLREEGTEPPSLVLCGGFGWKTEALERAIEAGEQQGWLHHLGYLEEAQVAALYRHALLVVLPSIYEGFGLPAVEAMRFGVPLVASDIPVLREVAGEAAVFVSPHQPRAWADAVAALLADERRRTELARRGRARSRRYCWQRTAAETVGAWWAAAGRSGAPGEVTG